MLRSKQQILYTVALVLCTSWEGHVYACLGKRTMLEIYGMFRVFSATCLSRGEFYRVVYSDVELRASVLC